MSMDAWYFHLLPREPNVSFIFKGYNLQPIFFWGLKPSFFHGFLGSKGRWCFQKRFLGPNELVQPPTILVLLLENTCFTSGNHMEVFILLKWFYLRDLSTTKLGNPLKVLVLFLTGHHIPGCDPTITSRFHLVSYFLKTFKRVISSSKWPAIYGLKKLGWS